MRRHTHVPRWAYELELRNIAAQERLASVVEALGAANAAAQERLIAAQERLAAAIEALAQTKCSCAVGASSCCHRST